MPVEIKDKYSDIPWHEMYLLRNKVTYEYFGIDYEIIWDIATNYLPENIFIADGTAEELILQYPLLLENDGHGHFRNAGPEKSPYFSTKRSGRTAAIWDYDNDGDLDIIVSHIDLQATATLLRNDGGNLNHWLGLKLKGKNGEASAIAARVIVEYGNKKQVLINQWSTSYLTNHDPRVHVGLGKNTSVNKITIIWTDGVKETYTHPEIDHYLEITEGKGIVGTY